MFNPSHETVLSLLYQLVRSASWKTLIPAKGSDTDNHNFELTTTYEDILELGILKLQITAIELSGAGTEDSQLLLVIKKRILQLRVKKLMHYQEDQQPLVLSFIPTYIDYYNRRTGNMRNEFVKLRKLNEKSLITEVFMKSITTDPKIKKIMVENLTSCPCKNLELRRKYNDSNIFKGEFNLRTPEPYKKLGKLISKFSVEIEAVMSLLGEITKDEGMVQHTTTPKITFNISASVSDLILLRTEIEKRLNRKLKKEVLTAENRITLYETLAYYVPPLVLSLTMVYNCFRFKLRSVFNYGMLLTLNMYAVGVLTDDGDSVHGYKDRLRKLKYGFALVRARFNVDKKDFVQQ